jgi:hypothetical protein
MNHSENSEGNVLPMEESSHTEGAPSGTPKLAPLGGTRAQQIATALYGGHPPADYTERMQEGLNDEDR